MRLFVPRALALAPIAALAAATCTLDTTLSNVTQVRARGGRIFPGLLR